MPWRLCTGTSRHLSEHAGPRLGGEVLPEHASRSVSRFIGLHYREYPILGALWSLDQPMFENGKGTLMDIIPADALQF